MAKQLELTYSEDTGNLTLAIRTPGQTDLSVDVTPTELGDLIDQATSTPGEPVVSE